MKRLCLSFVLILCAGALGYGQNTFYFPQVANGLQGSVRWTTTMFITNPAATGTATASVTITFFQENTASLAATGTPFTSIVVKDENGGAVNNGNTIAFQIAGGQSKVFTSTGDGNYAGGYAIVTSNQPVSGSAVFSQFDASGTRLLGAGGVPSSVAVPKQALFVNTVGYDIGFALANPGAGTASVTVTLLNTSAVTVDTTTRSLGSNNHTAQFIGLNLFPNAPKMAGGTMQIASSTPLTTVALQFDTPNYAVFTSLPPVTIASLLLFEPMNALQRLVSTLFAQFA